jgi:hypothetical protein
MSPARVGGELNPRAGGFSEISGQPIRERLNELGHTLAIRFVDQRLIDRRSLISCRRPDGPLCAPDRRDPADVVPSRAVLDRPQREIVYPRDQRAALRRQTARQGLGKLMRQSLLNPRGCRVVDACAQRRDINANIADWRARLRKRVLTGDRYDQRQGAACGNRGATHQSTVGRDPTSTQLLTAGCCCLARRRHCEERSDEAIQGPLGARRSSGLLRFARNDGCEIIRL